MPSLFRPVIALVAILGVSAATAVETDPLSSWKDGPTKQAIVMFVEKATEEGAQTTCLPRIASRPSTMTAISGPRNLSIFSFTLLSTG